MKPPTTIDSGRSDGFRSGVTEAGGEVSLLDAFNVLLRNRRLIAGMALTAMVISVLVTLLTDRTYTSSAAFVTEARSSGTDLASVAAQFGVNLRSSQGERPPQFYANLLESRSILTEVLLHDYRTSGDANPRNLLNTFELEEGDPALRQKRGLELLADAIQSDVDRETGVVRFRVTMPSAPLAQAVSAQLLASIMRFNVESRQSRAREERAFIEDRLRAAEGELRTAQRRLAEFLQSNRDFQGSAQKQFEYDNLNTAVVLQRQLYSSLAEALEQARIAEVQNTPMVTVVDQPYAPAEPDSRGGLVRLILAAMLGLFLGVVLAFWRELTSNQPAEEGSVVEFRRLRREALNDLRRPWRALRRSG
ncbi:MAG: Wzz/FepE/Etk N-terminal domain-containing protein [Longimicrobiales bacterium]